MELTARASSLFPVFDAEVFYSSAQPASAWTGATGTAWTYFSGQFFLSGVTAPVSAVFRFDLEAQNGFLLFGASGVQTILRAGDTTTGPIPIALGEHFTLSWLAVTNGSPAGQGPGWVYGSLLGVDLYTRTGEALGEGRLVANPEPATLALTLPALLGVWCFRRRR